MPKPSQSYSVFTETDIYLFKSGKHHKLYEKFGAHLMEVEGEKGCVFSVWAPSATRVEVVGDFNYWQGDSHPLFVRWDSSGIWEGFIPGLQSGEKYKFRITSNNGKVFDKSDPYAFRTEHPPRTASEVYDSKFIWKDDKWMKNRSQINNLDSALSIYEVHLESWQKKFEENRSLSYTELADDLVNYVKWMGFTHVEFMPIMEYPYSPSWGYQITGYYAASSRFGYPDDLRFLIDRFHEAGIGVILDWVPAHFPSDPHGLANFDGSHLYEHPDPRRGYHPHWKSLIFNYGRPEVKSFLISNAFYWFETYHVDGLRVDAVASMLYLDYGREEGEWEPNQYGENINLEAVSFLQDLNTAVFGEFGSIYMIAEESTAYSGVTKPVDHGGLGFNLKWMMGWMNDTLAYFELDPIHRKYHQNEITFGLIYAFSENFILPFSHDEVVYGKQSLYSKMPGDEWQKFANLRALYSFMYGHPGDKLLFMGSELGQYSEWDYSATLYWHLSERVQNRGIQTLLQDLNAVFVNEPALHSMNHHQDGFQWIAADDTNNSILAFLRKGSKENQVCLVVLNLTPTPHNDYRVGVNMAGTWKLIFNSDDEKYAGSNYEVVEKATAEKVSFHGQEQSVNLNLPPLSGLYYLFETTN